MEVRHERQASHFTRAVVRAAMLWRGQHPYDHHLHYRARLGTPEWYSTHDRNGDALLGRAGRSDRRMDIARTRLAGTGSPNPHSSSNRLLDPRLGRALQHDDDPARGPWGD